MQRGYLLLAVLWLLLGVAGCADRPDTNLARRSGAGWRVLGHERGAQTSSLAAIVTSDRALDAAWAAGTFTAPEPVLDFSNQVGLILTPGVSGSCPDIVFEDLLIGEHEVFGLFDYPTSGRACTADFNPISFFFAVDRSALPDQFTLAVSETSRCFTCRMDVDLTDEVALEAELWAGPVTVEAAGSAPEENHVNVVRMINTDGGVGALLFPSNGWERAKGRTREMNSLRFIERVEGFVSECEGDLCTQTVCDVADCEPFQPVGEVCSLIPELKLEPQVLVVTFNGKENCTMLLRVDTDR